MHDLIPIDQPSSSRTPTVVTLQEDVPSIPDLFRFMADAELRFESLRLDVVNRTYTARGERVETIELLMHHPDRARVVRRRGDLASRDYDLWSSDGTSITEYNALSNTASIRPVRAPLVGVTDPGLPGFARVQPPRTALPSSLINTFVHPRGLCENVLRTGPVHIAGTAEIAGRACLVIEAFHPRTSEILMDRPDRRVEVAVDRMTGLVLGLKEQIGDYVTRDAQATTLELDPSIPDEAFRAHLSSSVRMIY